MTLHDHTKCPKTLLDALKTILDANQGLSYADLAALVKQHEARGVQPDLVEGLRGLIAAWSQPGQLFSRLENADQQADRIQIVSGINFVIERYARESGLRTVSKALDAAKAAHHELRHSGMYSRLSPREYEVIVCAALAAFEGTPVDFLRGLLDMEKGRSFPMDDILRGPRRGPQQPPGEPESVSEGQDTP